MLVTDLSKSFNPVPKPKDIEKNRKKEIKETPKKIQKKKKGIKKKSNKLAKLEKKRFSILTKNLDKCYLCNNKKRHMHEIFKGANRQISMKNGFCVPLCAKHHSLTETDSALDKALKIKCQKKFELKHSREEFIAIVGKSYIKGRRD